MHCRYKNQHVRLLCSWAIVQALLLTVCCSLSSADPLDTWHVRDLPPQAKARMVEAGVASGNGRLAVVAGGNIFTSQDGVAWIMRPQSTTAPLNGLSYCKGMFVAAGYEGTILTSPDGVQWTPRTSGTDEGLFGITYGNGISVVVGYDGTILTSLDGSTWTKRSSGSKALLRSATYANGTFVAAGSGGTLQLTAQRNGADLMLLWPECPAAHLEQTDSLTSSWTTATNQVSVAGGQKSVTLTPTANAAYFRLALE